MEIKAVIIDDEPLARARILRLLEETEGLIVVAECGSARKAIDIIHKKSPDLIFLDIEMHDSNGFTVIDKIKGNNAPLIIIVSAYDRYAIKAFEVDAVDYLHKPFDKQRFDQAIAKVKNHIKLRKASLFEEQIKEMVIGKAGNQNERYVRSLSIKESGRLRFIPVDEICYIETNGNYVNLHMDDGFKMYRSSMQKLELSLNPDIFIRIHRSFIVNIRKIKNIQYLNNSEYRFTLINKKQVISSRSFKDEIANILTMF